MDDLPHPTGLDDEPPASAADALAIITREQTRRSAGVAVFYVLWGVLWVLIGLAWFGGNAGLWSLAVSGIATGLLVVGGCIASAVYGSRMSRGVEGPSSRFGALLGYAWFAAMLGTTLLVVALMRLTDGAGAELIPALYVFVAGLLYAATGAFYRCMPDYVLGIVVQVVAVAVAFTPAPWHLLVMGIGGGGSLIAAGLTRRTAK